MAKDLPYFKFTVSEYINGDITLEDFYTQGVFTNICAFYWFKSGNITISEMKRRLSKAKPMAFQRLIDSGVIKVDGDNLRISFLDEQLSERGHVSIVNSENGKLGGRPKKSEEKPNALISESEQQNETLTKKSNIEERREEEEKKREEKKPQSAIDTSLFSDETAKAWVEWEQFRKELNKKLTPSTAKKQIQFLGGRAGPEIVAIINQSIKNGWTGLFELNKNGNRNTNQGSTRRADAVIEAGRDFGEL